MGLANIGWSGLILILVVLLLVFGPNKLPEIGKAFGKSLRSFKDATSGLMDDKASPPTDATVQRASTVEPIDLKDDSSKH